MCVSVPQTNASNARTEGEPNDSETHSSTDRCSRRIKPGRSSNHGRDGEEIKPDAFESGAISRNVPRSARVWTSPADPDSNPQSLTRRTTTRLHHHNTARSRNGSN